MRLPYFQLFSCPFHISNGTLIASFPIGESRIDCNRNWYRFISMLFYVERCTEFKDHKHISHSGAVIRFCFRKHGIFEFLIGSPVNALDAGWLDVCFVISFYICYFSAGFYALHLTRQQQFLLHGMNTCAGLFVMHAAKPNRIQWTHNNHILIRDSRIAATLHKRTKPNVFSFLINIIVIIKDGCSFILDYAAMQLFCVLIAHENGVEMKDRAG